MLSVKAEKIRVDNINGCWHVMDMATIKPITIYAELPECLEERVALLRLMDNEVTLKGVGFRYGNNIFYLDRTGEVDAAIKQPIPAGVADADS